MKDLGFHLPRIALLAAAAWSSLACAIDLTPGELASPRPGLNVVQVSYQQNVRGPFYVDGNEVNAQSKLAYRYLQVRVGRSFTVGDTPGLFYLELPAGSVKPGGSLAQHDDSEGLADTTLLFALWPYTDRERDRHLAVGGYLFLPSGEYRHQQPVNLGNNRVAGALQAGYQMGLSPRLSWMTAWDVVVYGANDAYGPRRQRLEQRPLHTLQTGLRYQLAPGYAVAANLIHSEGGRREVDGVSLRDRIEVDRYLLTTSADLRFGRVSLQYGRDLRTRNGFFEEDRWLLRYTLLF